MQTLFTQFRKQPFFGLSWPKNSCQAGDYFLEGGREYPGNDPTVKQTNSSYTQHCLYNFLWSTGAINKSYWVAKIKPSDYKSVALERVTLCCSMEDFLDGIYSLTSLEIPNLNSPPPPPLLVSLSSFKFPVTFHRNGYFLYLAGFAHWRTTYANLLVHQCIFIMHFQ